MSRWRQRRLLSADPVVAKQEFAEAIDAVEVALADDAATETKVAAYAAASQTLTDYVDLGAADAAQMVADVDAFSATGDLLLSEVGDAPTDVVTDYVDALRTGTDATTTFMSFAPGGTGGGSTTNPGGGDGDDPSTQPGDGPTTQPGTPSAGDWDGDGIPNAQDDEPGDPEAGGYDPDDVDGDGDKDQYDDEFDRDPLELFWDHYQRLRGLLDDAQDRVNDAGDDVHEADPDELDGAVERFRREQERRDDLHNRLDKMIPWPSTGF